MITVLIGILSLVLIGTGLFYFVATTVLGLVESRRRSGRSERRASSARTRPTAVYFLVPCLNEEGVIGSTLTRLLENEEARVVVVDDASEDRTADVVRVLGGNRALLISRRLPDARQGKGPALNAGLPAIVADVASRGLDPSRVLVCVMDADGELSDGAVKEVLPLFDDPSVGGVQLGVRISNRDANLLTAMQDFEFWGLAATAQLGRVRFGTVSLGGNGQFTRLSALRGLGPAPWSVALTEDLDLALRLMASGWRLTTTPEASVHQQAVVTWPALIRQRTRWFQGHMACIKWLRSLWGGPELSNVALLEVSAYLLIPWVFILPWSILFHIGLWELLTRLASAPHALGGNGTAVRLFMLAAWYLLGFGPSFFGGYLYYRQDRSVGRLRSLVLGHALVLCNYVAFISCWLAAIRTVRGTRGWEKTVRRGADVLVELLKAPERHVRGPAKTGARLRRPRVDVVVSTVVPPAPVAALTAAAPGYAEQSVMRLRMAAGASSGGDSGAEGGPGVPPGDRSGEPIAKRPYRAGGATLSRANRSPTIRVRFRDPGSSRPTPSAPEPALTGRLHLAPITEPATDELGSLFLTARGGIGNFAPLDTPGEK